MISFITTSIKRAWRGEEKLWIAFWVYFLVISVIYWPISLFVFRPLIGAATDMTQLYIFALFTLFLSVIMKVAQIIILWRCSKNTRYRLMTYLVKLVAVGHAASTVYGVYNVIEGLLKV